MDFVKWYDNKSVPLLSFDCGVEPENKAKCWSRPTAVAYRPGQRVWLSTKDPRFVGPFEVDRMVNAAVVCLRLPALMRVHPVFHVSHVKPVEESELSPVAKDPTPVRIIAGAPAYTVQQILDVCWQGHGWQYLVEWEGYGSEKGSWVPRRHILGGGGRKCCSFVL